MKLSLVLLFCIFFKMSLAQYTTDSTVKTQYQKMFERLPEEVKQFKDPHYKDNLGLLFRLRTDTINKDRLKAFDTSIRLYDPVTGKEDVTSPENDDWINEDQPVWLYCDCSVKGNVLQITSRMLLGFEVSVTLKKGKAKAVYYEKEKEAVFKTKLWNKKVNAIAVPVTINNLVIDRNPQKGINEIFGKIALTTRGFYSYMDAYDFRGGYIFKRINIQYLFRCNSQGTVYEL